MLLAGDIGGTKTVLALFDQNRGPRDPIVQRAFPSAKYGRLEAVVHEFLAANPYPVDSGCFGVAGPVVAGRSQITNLPWVMDEAGIATDCGMRRVTLLNDLQSIAYAVPILEGEEIATLSAGTPVERGNIGVIAPGTGLGEAFLTWEGGRYQAHATEGGHASFAPINMQQIGLLTYLHDRMGHGHVSNERVCSGGLGVPNLYDYLRATGYADEPRWLAEKLAATIDATPVIFDAAADAANPSPLCVAVVELFADILAAESGNLALKTMATAGVFIGGGIPPRILETLRQPRFLEAFTHKGRFKGLLSQMPLHVILNPNAALLGAAAYGLAMSQDAAM